MLWGPHSAGREGCRRRSSGGWVERSLGKSVSCVQSLHLVSRLGEKAWVLPAPRGRVFIQRLPSSTSRLPCVGCCALVVCL